MLEIKKMLIEEKTKGLLELCNSIHEDDFRLLNITNAYYKGMSYMSLRCIEDAKKAFEYVFFYAKIRYN